VVIPNAVAFEASFHHVVSISRSQLSLSDTKKQRALLVVINDFVLHFFFDIFGDTTNTESGRRSAVEKFCYEFD